MNQKLIDEFYDGNAKKFDEAIAEARRDVIDWKTIQAGATILPHLEIEAHNIIERRLGYLPAVQFVLPYEPFARSLIHSYRQGQLSQVDYLYQMEEHIKLIRNKDMEANLCLTYVPCIYKNYRESFVPYGQQVKDRITHYLGYEPKLEHSVIAELWFRKLFAMDNYKLPNCITAADYKVLTLIRYREILLEYGQFYADCSHLLGLKPIIL